MSAPPGINEGQSTTRPSLFNEKYYSWWKARIEDFLTIEDYELWTIVNREPLTPIKQNEQNETVPKDSSDFVAIAFRMMEKNAKAKKIFSCGLGPNAKENWDALQTAHEWTNQERKRDKALVLKDTYEDEYDDDDLDITLCNKLDYMVKDCPMWKVEWKK
ncbi:uncharacterized protein [Nicotiana tomentosiformis]|uniref:uncharacterized protein n=1 Tax=Nicotiana tomentosiformis TaxID=4098 RepID=UPI00388CDACC